MSNLANASSPASTAVGGRSGFNPVLDGIRGTAILLVMICHMTILDSNTTFDRLLERFTFMGWVGVDLFFVLSGFLITGILWDAKGSSHYFRNFYARRTLRIFPLYYLVIFTCIVFIPHILPVILSHVLEPGTVEQLQAKIDKYVEVEEYKHWFWLYLCNVPMAIHGKMIGGVLAVCWSLAIEEQFYLVWPMVVRFCTRRTLMRVCVGVFIAALLWRIGLEIILPTRGFAPGSVYVAVYVSTFSRMDALVTGAFLALLVRGPGVDLASLARKARPIALTCAPIAAVIAIAETYGPVYRGDAGPFIGQTPGFQTIGLTLLSLTFGSLLIMALASPTGRPLNRIFTAAWLRTLGKYAYALYLLHLPVRAVLSSVVFGPAASAKLHFPTILGSQLPGQLLFYPLSIGLSLAAAWISWRLFENPILKLKRYFPSGAESHAQPARPRVDSAPEPSPSRA